MYSKGWPLYTCSALAGGLGGVMAKANMPPVTARARNLISHISGCGVGGQGVPIAIGLLNMRNPACGCLENTTAAPVTRSDAVEGCHMDLSSIFEGGCASMECPSPQSVCTEVQGAMPSDVGYYHRRRSASVTVKLERQNIPVWASFQSQHRAAALGCVIKGRTISMHLRVRVNRMKL